MQKEHGQLSLPPLSCPQEEFTGHSAPVPMASLIISEYKISEAKDFYLYICFLPRHLSPYCTYHSG